MSYILEETKALIEELLKGEFYDSAIEFYDGNTYTLQTRLKTLLRKIDDNSNSGQDGDGEDNIS